MNTEVRKIINAVLALEREKIKARAALKNKTTGEK